MLAQINVENQQITSLVAPEAALARGSSFTNLYIPYKYVTNKILKGANPRQNIIALIDIYTFLIVDLTLYLHTHPDCEKTKDYLNTFKNELKKVKEFYNANFTPITMDEININGVYSKGHWPWEDRF